MFLLGAAGLLLADFAQTVEQAELRWRIARACLNLGDQAELLAIFEKGQAAARQAQAADPNNPWGQVKEQGRMATRYAAETSAVEKACWFEGSVPLPPLSDRQEALEIVRRAVQRMEALPSRSPKVEKDLKEARQLLKEWG